MSNFRIGQKVVCVLPIDELVKDKVYIINEIDYDGKNQLCLFLEGVYCGDKYFDFCGYKAERFRPLADISETTYNEVMQWIQSGQPIEMLN